MSETTARPTKELVEESTAQAAVEESAATEPKSDETVAPKQAVRLVRKRLTRRKSAQINAPPRSSIDASGAQVSGAQAKSEAFREEDISRIAAAVKSSIAASDDRKSSDHKRFWTWDRAIEILKVVATVWVALLGSYVTVQFNERQHELNRIEAISQMLPHISESDKKTGAGSGSGVGADHIDHMERDGAIWAIFRTANNRKMLRDLAALFPEDIYRVVSSIALSGELNQDQDALVALEVSSEKLAAKYSADPKRADLASRLYNQVLKLRARTPDDQSPLHVLDLTCEKPAGSDPTGDQLAYLTQSINDLAEAHLTDKNSQIVTKTGGHGGPVSARDNQWQAKQLFSRARQLGLNSTDQQVLEQVMRADLGLAQIYLAEQLSDDTFKYLKEAFAVESKITGKHNFEENLKAVDANGDGYASLSELAEAVQKTQARFKQIMTQFPDRGAEMQ
jgi:hypothetical protein